MHKYYRDIEEYDNATNCVYNLVAWIKSKRWYKTPSEGDPFTDKTFYLLTRNKNQEDIKKRPPIHCFGGQIMEILSSKGIKYNQYKFDEYLLEAISHILLKWDIESIRISSVDYRYSLENGWEVIHE